MLRHIDYDIVTLILRFNTELLLITPATPLAGHATQAAA